MNRTIQIQGTDEVMAMLGEPGVFYKGKWENVTITGVSEDKDVPLEVRTALVGLIVPTIFTKESIKEQTGVSFPIPENTRLAYCADVAEVLKSARKYDEAEQLTSMVDNPLDMYTIEPSCYELQNVISMDDFRRGRRSL